jgi:hypothetical protein
MRGECQSHFAGPAGKKQNFKNTADTKQHNAGICTTNLRFVQISGAIIGYCHAFMTLDTITSPKK